MTTAQMTGKDCSPSQDAADYLDLALSYLEQKQPVLIAVGGYSGSGKSTIATKVAATQNAILLSSDVERKAQLNARETEHLPASSYTDRSSQLNYQRLIEKAQYALNAKQVVVVDATFLSKEQRLHIESIAINAGVSFLGIWLDVPHNILASRIRNRSNNASDANVDVLQKQLNISVIDNSWNLVDASDSLDKTMKRINRLFNRVTNN